MRGIGWQPCSACTEDIELEKEIKELENQIENIHTKRRALRTIMNENHDPFIAKFPPEISSQIFIHYAPPVRVSDKNDQNSPFYLGAVCQKWRQLAWRTPQLWTSLFVRFKPHPSQLLAEHLERSASLPLTIVLSPDFRQIIDDKIYLEAINILNMHSSRWHILHSTLPACYLHRICGSLEGNPPLRQLVLRPLMESTQHRDACKVATFGMKFKPSPTHFTLAKYRLANIDIIWNHITSAKLEDIGIDECFEFMRRTPLLETLTLLRIVPSSGHAFPIPTTRIVLPHLDWLAIWNISDEMVAAKLFDSMCAPSLKHWNYQRWPRWGELSSASHVVSFIDQSSFSLKTFKIGGSRDLYSQVHIILYHLSSLEVLKLRFQFRNESPTDELLNWLCTSDESSPFLPHLQTLEFNLQFTFPWESLRRIFSSSSRRSLTVKINQQIKPKIPDEAAEELLKLVDEGFDLSVIRDGKVDVLEEYREKRHLSQSTHQ
jgi:hypothetical protein